jgi:DnaJ-class molecular chaperone
MNCELSPYDVLGVNHNATKDEIRDAYKQLSIKYHPDKNHSVDTTEKFLQIKSSYEILHSEDLRLKYDNMHNDSKKGFYDIIYNEIKNYFSQNINLVKAHNNELNKLNEIKKSLHIISQVNCTLEDQYMDRIFLIDVNRDTKEDIELKVNLRENISIYEGEGEKIKDIHGDIIIYTVVEKHQIYKQNNFNLYRTIKMNLYEYLYGGIISFIHLDGKEFNYKHNGFIGEKLVIEQKNMGMIINDMTRGELFLQIQITDLENDILKNKIFQCLY